MSFGKGLKKVVEKIDSPTLHYGFQEEINWVGCGNLALNRLLSGKYSRAMQYGKTVLISGVSGSGKSLVLATTARQAQINDNAHVFWIDVEKASDAEWHNRANMDMSEENFTFVQAAQIEEVKALIAKAVAFYDTEKEKGRERKLFIVVDSYSMLMTEKQMKEAFAGETVGDQGQHAKQTKDLIKATAHLIARRNIIVAGVVHSMESQDKYAPDEIVLGGRGAQYIADVVLVFSKYKLKNEGRKAEGLEQVGADLKAVVGIKAKAKIYKSRYSRPETSVDVQVVFGKGIDKYSGLFDLLRDEGIIVMPTNGWYSLTVEVPGCPPTDKKFQKPSFTDFADTLCEYLDANEDIELAPVNVVAADSENDED